MTQPEHSVEVEPSGRVAAAERLSVGRIAVAALEIIDELGATGLTMRRLGERLGVDPMAVYHHLPNRQAIVDRAVEQMLGELTLPAAPLSPLDTLRHVTREYRRVLLAHPEAIDLLPGSPLLSTERAIAAVDLTFAALHDLGVPVDAAVPAYRMLTGFTLGATLSEAKRRPFPALSADDAEAVIQAYRDAPAIVAATPYLRAASDDAVFEAGLEACLTGIQQVFVAAGVTQT